MFSEATAIRPIGPGRYQATADSTWFQGPGAYGGWSGAVLLRAMQAEVGPRPARTFTAQYATTVAAGDAAIEVAVERTGATTAFASARLVQDGVRVHAIATFGEDRSRDFDEDRERPPAAPPASAVPAIPFRPPAPVFLQQFRVHLIEGFPYSGAERSGVRAWIRSAEVEPVDAPLALGLLDVLPPAILPRATSLRPMSTLVWHVHLLADLPGDGTEPWLVDVESRITRAGFSDQETRLFRPSGELVGYGRQLVAVIR